MRQKGGEDEPKKSTKGCMYELGDRINNFAHTPYPGVEAREKTPF